MPCACRLHNDTPSPSLSSSRDSKLDQSVAGPLLSLALFLPLKTLQQKSVSNALHRPHLMLLLRCSVSSSHSWIVDSVEPEHPNLP
ncbi:hypothetical protein M5K25_010189 [Dendrobium thyrsiflorum]|uniref:Uncharacterized protein n=1 Tax=Dendrobium thyrsiflorum TaxID=117978 RepID=A0ABD0UZT3_DENTH